MNTEKTGATGGHADPFLPPRRGWVFHDADCPFCQRCLAHVGPALARRGFAFIPLQEPWVAPALGIPESTLREEMQLRLPDGRLLAGAAAWRELLGAIRWLKPLVSLLGVRGIDRLAAHLYRWVAARRHCLGGRCRLESTPAPRPRRRTHPFFEPP